jgi:hypothetical protein
MIVFYFGKNVYCNEKIYVDGKLMRGNKNKKDSLLSIMNFAVYEDYDGSKCCYNALFRNVADIDENSISVFIDDAETLISDRQHIVDKFLVVNGKLNVPDCESEIMKNFDKIVVYAMDKWNRKIKLVLESLNH